MPSDPGSGVPGQDAPERVAGALAELGVTELDLRLPGQPASRLTARGTDLPGVLRAAPAGAVLIASAPEVTIVVEAGGLSWTAPDPGVRRELARLARRRVMQ